MVGAEGRTEGALFTPTKSIFYELMILGLCTSFEPQFQRLDRKLDGVTRSKEPQEMLW